MGDYYPVFPDENGRVTPTAVEICRLYVFRLSNRSRGSRLEMNFRRSDIPDGTGLHPRLFVDGFDVLEKLPYTPAVPAYGRRQARPVVTPFCFFFGFLVPDHQEVAVGQGPYP